MREVAQAFDAVASGYDGPRRRLIPCFDDFYGTAVAIAVARQEGCARTPAILDLGAGTGLLAGFIAAAVPTADITLVDAAPAMLEVAAAKLAARTVVADLADPLPAGEFDLIVSALAIHHLPDAGKRDLYRRIYAALTPGGVFVNADQVLGPTAGLERRYQEKWLAGCVANGATEEELAGAAERMAYDLPATLDAQLDWLREAGFTDVDCHYKWWRFAVFGGTKS